MSNETSTEQRCFKTSAESFPSIVQSGKIVLQTYHIGFIISGSLAVIAIVTSFWLISKHLQWYTNKREQRYIVRLLFMVPIYALTSFLSFLFWNHSTPIILVRDAYEAIVLTAFFYLLLMYLSHGTEEQKRIFTKAGLSREADVIAMQRGQEIAKWIFPLGFVKWKPKDGLYFLQLMKWGVLQYCVIRPTATLAAVILNYIGLYCESSWGLGWGHIYITIIMSLSVTIAMFCLIQLYVPVAKDLSIHKPLLKLFSVKAVVFLTFWQATFLSVLSMFGIVKETKYMTAEDVNIGIGAVLECFEMMIFGFVHILAFTYKPYAEQATKGIFPLQTPRWRSLVHAMDFRETFKEIWVGCVYMFDHMRGREPTPDFGVIRENHYEGAFGRPRPTQRIPSHQNQKTYMAADITYPAVQIEVDRKVEVNGRRQWLTNEKDRHRIMHPEREKSEGLQEQIDKELQRLGYINDAKDADTVKSDVDLQPAGQRPWWRNIYDRISQSGKDLGEEEKGPLPQRGPSRWRSSRHHRHQHLESDTFQLESIERNVDDQPPPSVLNPSDTRPSQSRAGYQDYDEDRHFYPENDYCPPLSDTNPSRGAEYLSKDRPPFPFPRASPEYDNSLAHASHQPSRSYRTGPVFSSAKLGRCAASLSHAGANGPYGPISPVRYPPGRGTISSYSVHESPRSPSRVVPVMPLPLAKPRPQQCGTAQYASAFTWSPPPPPPPPPKDTPELPTLQPQRKRDTLTEYPHRKSTHRREPAAAPSNQQDLPRESQSSTRDQYSGLPLLEYAEDPNICANAIYEP